MLLGFLHTPAADEFVLIFRISHWKIADLGLSKLGFRVLGKRREIDSGFNVEIGVEFARVSNCNARV